MERPLEIYARKDGFPSVGYPYEGRYDYGYTGVWQIGDYEEWNWQGPLDPDGNFSWGDEALANHYHRVYHWNDLSEEQKEAVQGTPLEKHLRKGLHLMTKEEIWGVG